MGKRPPIPPDIENGTPPLPPLPPPARPPFRPPIPVPWYAWLVPLIFAANFITFATTMYVNDCPSRSDNCLLFDVLGRLSFQPIKENMLLGPSIPTLRRLGALERRLVEEGEKWRLISCIWLHGGLLHLLANMISLLCIGMRLEQEFGFLRIGALYVISGLGGSIMSCLTDSRGERVSVGASGALFGLLGAMLSELITNWTIYENKVLGLKLIWRLLSNSPSLWADWHMSIHLTENSFWTIEPSQSDSWTWKRILKLRPLALRFCKGVLGNGLTLRFWYDCWTPFGQLIKHIGENGPRALRVRKNALVADAISNSNWSLPNPRSQQEVDLHIYLTTIPLPLAHHVSDLYEWRVADCTLNVFNSQVTWEALRPRQETKPWHDIVWFKGAIPKHAFTMWVANYDRLPTRARLASWGLAIPVSCPLCSSYPESRDHLFLSCQFTNDIWSLVFPRCSSPARSFANWAELLAWIREPRSRRKLLLRKLASQALIFHLWKQRNNLVHNNISQPYSVVFRALDREMRNIISSRRSNKHFRSLMVLWIR